VPLDCGQRIGQLAFSPDGEIFVAGLENPDAPAIDSTFDGLVIWNVDNWSRLPEMKKSTGGILSLAFSPDGKWLLTGHDDRSIRLWDAKTFELDRVWDSPMPPVSLVFSNDSSIFVSGSLHDNAVRVWDMATRKLISTTRGHTDSVWDIAFLPDGKTLLSAGLEREGLKFWKMTDLVHRPWRGASTEKFCRAAAAIVSTRWDSKASCTFLTKMLTVGGPH